MIKNGNKVVQFHGGMEKISYIKFAYNNRGQFPKIRWGESIMELVSVKPDGTISTYYLLSKSELAKLLNNDYRNFNFKKK